ncbi:MAG: UDP-N-acetylmuramoyl-L-alanyl-D-glutamate--2,6-diaminopimelate ligase [Muribaculaceae bacterium]|nr:UDP-N-acetylmuramoyl-L-alanyl-D-glutamate--2,6-diaminopimelate ligase [Muribaculaceae bacterium]
MAKDLKALLASLNTETIKGSTDKVITDVVCDSRKVSRGALYVAVRGALVDAHKFIPDVVAAGAAAVVCEEIPEQTADDVTYIQVANGSEALGILASEWYDRPSEQLKLVGVTGTNGKTTVATLLYEMTRLLGYKAGLLSTVQNIVDQRVMEAKQTTPDHLTLNRLLREMVDCGCEYAFMEVSSHSCVQHRIDGLKFSGAIFTNLTRDHLDFHKTVDNYIAAKQMFFDGLPKDAFALINADDKVGSVMVQNTAAKTYTYSLRTMADFRGKVIEERIDGTSVEINRQEVEVLFTGRFNVYNLLSVYGASVLLGFDPAEVLVKTSLLVPVSGRFQTFRSPLGYTAVVDYAHTPDALVNVLDTIRDVVGEGKVITVCGCGGNRDKGKRPIMAHEAVTRSHQLILTSDNPRDEEPEAILLDMASGLERGEMSRVLKITDRREAIRTACRLAQKGDVVLVAGKGHENYQEIKGVKHHFDDREVIQEIFAEEQGQK